MNKQYNHWFYSIYFFAKRIVYLISQSDEEAQKEARVRRRMEEEVKEQRSLIDALTAECLALREESAALQVSCSPKLLLFYFFLFSRCTFMGVN